METQKEINNYICSYIKELDEEHLDDDFNPQNLRLLLQKNKPSLQMLLDFDLQPQDLAKIINSIGGAEYYEFSEIELIKMIILLHPYKAKAVEVSESVIPWDTFQTIIQDLFGKRDGFYGVSKISEKYLGLKKNMINLDIALGHLIHIQNFLFYQDYLLWPPSGDDTYFDYYPGGFYYNAAIMEWFLNSENRIQ